MKLPTEDSERQKYDLWNFYYNYFPNAQLALAKHSYDSNMKHNGTPGATWAKEKSVGSFDRVMRHLVDFEDNLAELGRCDETEKELRSAAWRMMEMLERYICKMEPFNEKQEDMPAYKQNSQTENKPMSFPKWAEADGWKYNGEWINDNKRSIMDECGVQKLYSQYVASC